MKIYEAAQVRFDPKDVTALKTLLTRTRLNDDGEVEVVQGPPKFPLTSAKVIFNGNTAVISVPSRGGRARRVVRLVEASLTEPRRDGDPVVITGVASELADIGIPADDAQMTATIEKFVVCSTC